VIPNVFFNLTQQRFKTLPVKKILFHFVWINSKGKALKILTRAEDMADGKDNLETHAHTEWKRAIKKDHQSLHNFFFSF